MHGDQIEFCERMSRVDFSPLLLKLVAESKSPWTQMRAELALQWYKRFLFLAYRYPERRLAVLKDIDEIWHLHILDTKKYFKDCDVLFGRYLHHCPVGWNCGRSI